MCISSNPNSIGERINHCRTLLRQHQNFSVSADFLHLTKSYYQANSQTLEGFFRTHREECLQEFSNSFNSLTLHCLQSLVEESSLGLREDEIDIIIHRLGQVYRIVADQWQQLYGRRLCVDTMWLMGKIAAMENISWPYNTSRDIRKNKKYEEIWTNICKLLNWN